MRMAATWQMYALGSACFAALTALFGKIGVGGMNADLAMFLRTVVIVVITAGIVSVRREWARPETLPMSALAALIASAIATGLSWVCYYRALKLGPASRVAPIDKLSVVLVVLAGWLILGEPMTWRTATGTIFITFGALLLIK